MWKEDQFNLGDVVKDSITGFKGMIVARTEWLNGCVRLTIQSQSLDKDGKITPTETLDVEQCVLVSASKNPAHKSAGGPMPDPVRR